MIGLASPSLPMPKSPGIKAIEPKSKYLEMATPPSINLMEKGDYIRAVPIRLQIHGMQQNHLLNVDMKLD